MNPFMVLSPGHFINIHGVELTIRSFATVYHKVSPKHQRRLKLVIIEEEAQIPELKRQLKKEKLGKAVEIIKRQNVEQTEAAYKNASLFLFPTLMDGYKIIPEALSFGLPVLTYESPGTYDFLDNTCSMLVPRRRRKEGHAEFSRILEMLYFDPEVRKILAKGAMCRYEKVA